MEVIGNRQLRTAGESESSACHQAPVGDGGIEPAFEDGREQTGRMPSPRIVRITLYVETDDDAEVERLADDVGRVACPDQDDLTWDHACPIPWFVVTSLGEDLETWRDLLNR